MGDPRERGTVGVTRRRLEGALGLALAAAIALGCGVRGVPRPPRTLEPAEPPPAAAAAPDGGMR